jgi:hypothetical protein
MFPVYLNSPGFKPPASGAYYLVSKNGIFFHTEAAHATQLVKVDAIPHLQEASQTPRVNLPKLPGTILAQALFFFRKVYETHNSESYVTLLYSKKLNQFRLWCPTQTVSYASVDYDRTDTVPASERNYMGNDGPGWQMVGTIHSHCNFSAFHSGTDEFDESTFDGLHITLGHVDRKDFSMVSTISFSDKRTSYLPSDLVDGVVPAYEEDVTEKEGKGLFTTTTTRREIYFKLALTSEDWDAIHDWSDTELPIWMAKVSKRAIFGGYSGKSSGVESSTGSSESIGSLITPEIAEETRKWLIENGYSTDYWGPSDSKVGDGVDEVSVVEGCLDWGPRFHNHIIQTFE